MTKNKTVEQRFLEKVQIDSNGCWIWTGAKIRGGYGNFAETTKRHWQAHRFSYHFYVNPVFSDDDVLHTCDNPSCVNPKHLFLGDDKLNAEDRNRKGRSARGEKISILSEDQVYAIRDLLKAKVPRKLIAQMFGVGTTCITDIYSGRTWAWLKEKSQ